MDQFDMRSNSIWLRQITTEASISNYNFVAGTMVNATIRAAHTPFAVETLKTPYVHRPRSAFIPSGLVSDHFPFAACARVMTANDRFCATYTGTNEQREFVRNLTGEAYRRLEAYRFDNANSYGATPSTLSNTLLSLFAPFGSSAEDLPRVSRIR